MDSNNEKNYSGEQSNDNPFESSPQSKLDSSPYVATHQNNRSNKEEDARKIEDRKKYGEKWKDPLVIVTIALAVATFMLYLKASDEGKTAEKAVAEQKYNDSINQVEQRSKDSTDSITRKITFASIKSSDSISKATLQQQINSFRNDSIERENSNKATLENIKHQQEILAETKQEFKIQNTPYFECMGYNIVDSTIGKRPTFFFNIINLGNSIQKIISGTYALLEMPFNDTVDNFIFRKDLEDASIVNRYITKETPIPIVTGTSTFIMTPKLSNEIKNGSIYLFIYGVIKYVNETDSTKKAI